MRASDSYIRVPRPRWIKPEFFKHEDLFDLEKNLVLPARLAFAGLWCQADREGRFVWRPRTLVHDILPHDGVSGEEFSRLMDALADHGFLVKYEIDGDMFGCMPKWHKHQVINGREQSSVIPPPTVEAVQEANKQLDLLSVQDLLGLTREPHVEHASSTREPRVEHASTKLYSRKGREGNGMEESLSEQSSSPPAFELPLINGQMHAMSDGEILKWEQTFPGVDVHYQLRKMLLWLDNNPRRRKTKRGVNKFVTNWLGEEYEKLSAQKSHGGQRARPTASQRMAAGRE